MAIFRIFIVLLASVLPLKGVARDANPDTRSVLVFAASSMTDVLGELGMRYERETGTKIIFSFAGSSILARQIDAGAPADIFVSANRAWADYLVEREVSHAGVVIAQNRLAVLGGADVPDLVKFDDLLTQSGIAVADPDHVPAGIYARQAFEAAGLWAELAPDLRRTSNVRLAAALAAIGAVDYAIGYASDAVADDRLEIKYLISASLHGPIEYLAARTLNESSSAERFFQFLRSDQAGAIFAAYGFAGRVE